jgi:Predicted transcriptional regulator
MYVHIGRTHGKDNTMSIQYKIDVLQTLKDAGFTTYKLRKEKLIGEAVMQRIREGAPIAWDTLATLCQLLNCQPGDIIEYTEKPKPEQTV